MNTLRRGLTALLFAVSLHAGTVASQSLFLSYSTSSNSNQFSGAGSQLTTGLIDADGWQGSASLLTNVVDGSVSFPLSAGLTDLTMTCVNEQGCGLLDFTFDAVFNFSSLPDNLLQPTPYSVSVTGSGPDASLFYKITSGDNQEKQLFSVINGNIYNFSVSDFLGAADGSVGADTVEIFGEFQIGSALGNQIVSLQDSAEISVGLADTPEPATVSLAAGVSLFGIAGWAWRRRYAHIR